jgi:fibronectin-binding autotransporter adhesin
MRTKYLIICLALGLGALLALLAGLHTAQAAPTVTDRFVKPTGGGDCSQGNPCALQTALISATGGDTIYVAGGTYTGTGSTVITITKSITLYGGWDGAGSGAVVRDPALYPTTLDGEWARRVVYVSGNITPTLDGFIVTRGNATGLLANCPSNSDGCGGGIFVRNAHPLILNNTITNNIAAITTTGNPTVAIGHGGGLCLNGATRAVVRYNLIISNAGSTAYWGMGGGLYLSLSSDGVQVQFNQVLSNAATTTDAGGDGGGIYGGPNDTLIQGNIIEGNRTNGVGAGAGAGLFQYSGSAHYLGNLVQGNTGSSAVELWYSQARFEGNRVVDNATASGGIYLIEYGGGAGPTLVNNVVARNGSRALSVYGYNESNILTATLLHNTLVGAGSGYGVYAQYAALYLTNTIVASTTWGITNTTPVSSTILADYTLFHNTLNHSSSGVVSTNEVGGDPRFVDPAGGDYHLGHGSAAIDAGVDAGVTTDIDGDTRPIGPLPDIGADERRLYIHMPLVLRGPGGHGDAGFWPDD